MMKLYVWYHPSLGETPDAFDIEGELSEEEAHELRVSEPESQLCEYESLAHYLAHMSEIQNKYILPARWRY